MIFAISVFQARHFVSYSYPTLLTVSLALAGAPLQALVSSSPYTIPKGLREAKPPGSHQDTSHPTKAVLMQPELPQQVTLVMGVPTGGWYVRLLLTACLCL